MAQKNYKLRKFGPITERRDYSVTKQTLPVMDILSTAKESFENFLKEGIEELLLEHYPIEAADKKVKLNYVKKSLRIEQPFKKSTSEGEEIKKCKAKGINLASRVYITLKREITGTGEVKQDEVLLGEIPLMTSGGSFIINGSEKVIVSQLIRSPGAYFGRGVRNKQ
ncbi:DNA-directed RNA polymerase subunit beta, partial [Mycoplasmopsis pullorum]